MTYKRPNTQAVHAGSRKDPATNALITPIYANSTFAHETPGEHKGYDYARFHNPTRTAFEEALAELEGGKHGYAFSSGMAAATAALSLLPANSHIVVSDDLYGGTYNLLENTLKVTTGLEITYADLSTPDNLEANIRKNTRMVWVESPSNPLLKLTPLTPIADIAKQHNLISVVDNTFATPYLQKPLAHGFDIILHSTTKYINGHSDIIGGALITANEQLATRIHQLQINLGAVPSPFDVFLAHRGLKTLPLRMQKHCENALKFAAYFAGHEKVQRVIYPGLKDHPQHELAKNQMRAFGGIVSIELKGDLQDTEQFLKNLRIFTLAVSLGGVESLVQSPALMTHKGIPREKREAIGLTDGLLRVSIGIEDVEDLIADFEQALDSIRQLPKLKITGTN